MRDGIGCASFHDLVARFGSAAHAFDATVARAERQRALDAADAALARGVQLGATVFTPGDADFPARLRELREVP
ncbi:MAG TPA: hypothetical protein VG818_13160, partial [Gemmatimonadaceae bacterium]|nr:hypothetical protein [Gemmatimonadaceae bacterium]